MKEILAWPATGATPAGGGPVPHLQKGAITGRSGAGVETIAVEGVLGRVRSALAEGGRWGSASGEEVHEQVDGIGDVP